MEKIFKMNVVNLYKTIIVLLIGSLIFFLTSCEKNIKIVTQEINVEKFELIEINSLGEFNVEYGEDVRIVYKGDKNYFDILDIKVVDEKLIIDTNKESIENFGDIEFFITLPKIKRLEISGSSNVVLNDFLLQEEDLSIEVIGQGNIKINNFENVKNLDINISGTSTIDVLSDFKQLHNLNLNISGTGIYNGYLLKANNCSINFSGNGDCKVFAVNTLNIDISGNGEVFYKGKPKIRSNISGGGFILDQN